MPLPLILAITGASGAPYARRMLEVLASNQVPTWLIVSSHGWRLLETECAVADRHALQEATGGDWSSVTLYPNDDRGAHPASGSCRTRGMVVCPCSMGTLSAVAHGSSRSLIERAADVTLKERRPLIVVPREYHRPERIDQLVDFVVQRVLDRVELDIEVADRWTGDTSSD